MEMQTMQLFVDWTLNGTQVLTGIAALAIGTAGLAMGLRWWVHRRSQQLAQNAAFSNSTLERKHDDVQIYQYSGSLKWVGAICAMTFAGLLLAWTQWDRDETLVAGNLEAPEELIMEPPIIVPEPNRAPPPPPPPSQFKAVDEDLPDPEPLPDQNPEDPVVVYDPNNNTGTVGDGKPLEKPVEQPEERTPEKVVDVYLVAEQMPRFPSKCETLKGTNQEKQACAEKELLSYIYAKIRYPQPAREVGLEGRVMVSFVVTAEGTLDNIQVLREPAGSGGILGKEAVRVVKLMNEEGIRWVPGKQSGRNVAVKFTLPVTFKLTK